jgi:hypothetical protein
MTTADKNVGTFSLSGAGISGGSKTFTFSDLVFGNPPLEANVVFDSGDLSQHGIFPTYFAEIAFHFDPSLKASSYNTQDQPGGLTPNASGSLFYQGWNVDVSGLTAGYDLHFDLYDEAVSKSKKSLVPDIDRDDFAPFSHDAISGPHTTTTTVPDASSTAGLFGLALLGMAGFRQRFALR